MNFAASPTMWLLTIGGIAAASGLIAQLTKELPVRVSAVQCDNPSCSKMATPELKAKAPEGWLITRVRQQGNTGKVFDKVTCSPKCVVDLLVINYLTEQDGADPEATVALTNDAVEARR